MHPLVYLQYQYEDLRFEYDDWHLRPKALIERASQLLKQHHPYNEDQWQCWNGMSICIKRCCVCVIVTHCYLLPCLHIQLGTRVHQENRLKLTNHTNEAQEGVGQIIHSMPC